MRLIYDTQAASPEIKKVKSPSKVEKRSSQMARDNEEKGERKCRRNKGIKITDSQKDCAAITNTHAHTYTGTFERQKGQHHWHHMLRNLCYCHTTSYAYVCVCVGIEYFLLTLNPCRIQFPPSHCGCPFRNRYLVFNFNSNCCIKYGTALHFNWIHTLSTHTLPIVMVCICVRGGGAWQGANTEIHTCMYKLPHRR